MNDLKKIFEQLRAQWNKLPVSRRFVIALAMLGTLGAVAFMSLRGPAEEYQVLFSGLATEDAAKVVAELKAQNVPYKIEGNGAVIEVPAAKVHELRLGLAASGLPRGGGIGFELFDKQSFGTTSFVEQMNYRRALQGELARTIMSLDEVERARVHVAVPERTLYKDEDEAPSASVMLQLKSGRKLTSAQVRGVVNLVAASVAGLKAERITVVDEAGTPLWAGDDASAGMEAASEIERSLTRRVRDIVERVVGAGHAQVVVTAELDESRSERTEDLYDKDKTALRSESKTEDRSDGNGSTGGVAGARGNLPGAGAPSTGPGEAGRVRLAETKNYEVNHVVNHTVQPKTRIKRLHVAVLVDQTAGDKGKSVPRSAEELTRITALARAAAGLEDERGDKIEVASAAFVAPAPEAAPAPAANNIPKWAPFAGAGAALLLIIIAAASLARRKQPLVGEIVPTLPVPVGQLEASLAQNAAAVAAAAAGSAAGLPAGTAGALPTPSARDRALSAAREDAGRAARVLSSWLAEEPAAAPKGNA